MLPVFGGIQVRLTRRRSRFRYQPGCQPTTNIHSTLEYHQRQLVDVFFQPTTNIHSTLEYHQRQLVDCSTPAYQTTKRNDELRLKVSSFLLQGPWASEVFVRRWKVRTVTCWFELSLLCGFLGSALLRGLLGSALLPACFLSTFFSCHSFYVLLLSSLVFVSSRPQDTVLSSLLWARVNGAQHLAI